MSDYLLYGLLSAFTIPVFTLGAYAFVLRGRRTHTRRLGPRPAITPTASATATVATGTAPTRGLPFTSWVGVGALVIAIGVIFYFGVYTSNWESPAPSELGMKGQKSWFYMLLCFLILAAIVAIVSKGAVRKVLLWGVVIAAFAMLTLLPLWAWVTSASKPQIGACSNATAESQTCQVSQEWSAWFSPATNVDGLGLQLCLTSGVEVERKSEKGTSFWRVRGLAGTTQVSYALRKQTYDCVWYTGNN